MKLGTLSRYLKCYLHRLMSQNTNLANSTNNILLLLNTFSIQPFN
jgi:hypothetical protein